MFCLENIKIIDRISLHVQSNDKLLLFMSIHVNIIYMFTWIIGDVSICHACIIDPITSFLCMPSFKILMNVVCL